MGKSTRDDTMSHLTLCNYCTYQRIVDNNPVAHKRVSDEQGRVSIESCSC